MRKKKGSSELEIFCYKSMPVRTTIIDGEIWFVAKDVCDVLDIANSRDPVSILDDDEKGVAKTDTPGGMQDMTIISEAGLYALIFRSNKPEVKAFSRWVRHEVLPSIHKTGSYSVKPKARTRERTEKPRISRSILDAAGDIVDMALEAQNDDEFRKVIARDNIFKARTGYSALEAAGIYIHEQPDFNVAHEWNWTCVDWEFHYELALDSSLTLPKPYSEEHFEPEEQED